MTHYPDLTPCSYFSGEDDPSLRAVGWLEYPKTYSIGNVESAFFDKLKSLLHDPFQPFASTGVHHCDLCQFDAPAESANLFVPGGGFLYVCPKLILHYIAAHRYCPPVEFQSAVMQCPPSQTMEYKKLFLQNGGRALLHEAG